MTPEIDKINAEIEALEEKRETLVQAYLATKAIAQTGELITWGRRRIYKGRVVGFQNWFGDVSYVVRTILKNGTEGAVVTARKYDNPTKYTE